MVGLVDEVPDIFTMIIMKRNWEEVYDNVGNIDNAVHCFENYNNSKQARKLQDAQAEKLTSLQAKKLTSLQAEKLKKLTRWQVDKMTSW